MTTRRRFPGKTLFVALLTCLMCWNPTFLLAYQVVVVPDIRGVNTQGKGSTNRQQRHVTRSGSTLWAAAAEASSSESTSTTDETSSSNNIHDTPASTKTSSCSGLYKKFSDHAWKRLSESGWFQEMDVPPELAFNEAPSKGPMKQNRPSMVRISTRAMVPSGQSKKGAQKDLVVQYARIALLETVPAASSLLKEDLLEDAAPQEETAAAAEAAAAPPPLPLTHSEGIQVLNFIILPSNSTTLPVLGIDLVSLPGGRHLLLLDAQPMIQPNPYEEKWQAWYQHHVEPRLTSQFPWGGDFPEAVQQYVSRYALWTRLQEVDDPVNVIESDVWTAFVDHLDVYLDVLQQHWDDQQSSVATSPSLPTEEEPVNTSAQEAYLEYRKNNDPAKPMLTSLYGEEWTEKLLEGVLFPVNK